MQTSASVTLKIESRPLKCYHFYEISMFGKHLSILCADIRSYPNVDAEANANIDGIPVKANANIDGIPRQMLTLMGSQLRQMLKNMFSYNHTFKNVMTRMIFQYKLTHVKGFILVIAAWQTDITRGSSWENLFLAYVNNKGADQPAHPHSLISAFVARCLNSIISLVSISEISSL